MIRVENITKWYGDTLAVEDLSFEINEGEIVGFLGPNGAGKSTTLRILTGYLAPSSGRAWIAGHDVFEDSLEARRVIGYLPESVPLYEEMRVEEYLRFRARLKEVPRREIPGRVAEAMDRAQVAAVARKLIGHLSKGYRQRVGIAAALLHHPDVLVLDEPTVGLDPSQIRTTRRFIRELAGDHTVLLSSHILPEIEATCERVLILNRGRAVAMDTPTDLVRRFRGDTLFAEARGSAGPVRAALEAIVDAERVEVRAEADDILRIEVEARRGRDPREAVSRAITSAGGVLRELRGEAATLEEVFVRITSGEIDPDEIATIRGEAEGEAGGEA